MSRFAADSAPEQRKHGPGGRVRAVFRTTLLVGLVSAVGVSAGGSAASGRHSAAAEPLKIAYIFNGPINDGSYNQAGYNSMLAVKKAFGSRVDVSYHASILPGAGATQAVTSSISDGVKLIISPATGNLPYVKSLLQAHPDVRYEGYLDSRPAGTPDNFGVWSTKDDDGAYILGMMLAAASKTDLLGFVASFPFPGILTEANGLLLGARAINPNMKLRIIYVSSFYDPAKETVAAKALIAAGAGGLFTTNNDPATGVAAEAAGVPFVSFDLFNGQKFAPKEYLNSVYFDNTQMEKQFVTNTLSGKPNPQDFVLNGFADGSLTLGKPGPAYQRLVSAANRAKIAAALGRLKSGALNPYTGPLKDQKGKVVVPPGKRLSARESISTPWLLEGITSSG